MRRFSLRSVVAGFLLAVGPLALPKTALADAAQRGRYSAEEPVEREATAPLESDACGAESTGAERGDRNASPTPSAPRPHPPNPR